MIKDSGNREQFYDSNGNPTAVRDIQDGKGRCDLLPLDVVAVFMEVEGWEHRVIDQISKFQQSGNVKHLNLALSAFFIHHHWRVPDMLLEVSIHFEEGAKKYGEQNWRKGIPVRCYINSSIRHYLKWLRGDKDEPHDRAFVWNILCCIWTCIHKPELNEYSAPLDK
jgi:hypothetical protein